MAPTICSEKKQMRVSGLKEARRHHAVAPISIAGTSSPSSSSSSSSSTSSSSGRAAANGALQASSVLRYVAKGSMNPTGRRRLVRVPRKLQISNNDDDTSSDYTSISAIQETSSIDRESIDEYIHSSDSNSSSSNNTSNSNDSGNSSNKTRSVLQPTMGNKNFNSNKSLDYHSSPMNDYVDDSDSGYDNTPGPRSMVKSYPQLQQQPQNTEGLLSIAIKTINLVQRNRLLQKRLAQLQLETSAFIASVLANPENSHFQMTAKAEATLSNMLLRH